MVGKLFVVSACSGAGKTTLVTKVVEKLSSEYSLSRVITYTTKKPGRGDIDGKDYYFLTVSEFEYKIESSFFLEWSKAYGDYYGSPSTIKHDLEEGKSLIIITDVQGALTLGNEISTAILIWVDVPNKGILEKRLFKRNRENNDRINERIVISLHENNKFQQTNLFRYIVANNKLGNAVSELESIIINELKKR